MLSQDNGDDSELNRVKLMSFHASKGLEFPAVFMIGMEEGIFPSARTLAESGELDEERRLCYVGITRAQSHLFLSSVKERRKYNEVLQSEPSRFLKEIPKELFDRSPFDNEDDRQQRATEAARSFFEQFKKNSQPS
mgnify:CR=1 FL=1